MSGIINEVSVQAKTLRGKISVLDTIHGKSAYEIAVINGFSGTEAEWLESLKGEKGDKGDKGDSLSIEEIIESIVSQTNKISTVTLLANQWVGETSPYSQVVDIVGATENSKIDINPTVEQLNIFHEKDITFVVANNKGIITVYCIGQKPANDYTIQVSITEVKMI